MTLENLLRTGQLKAHAADEREILRLLDSAQLALKDAAVADLSSDSRLNLAYRAMMQTALAFPSSASISPGRASSSRAGVRRSRIAHTVNRRARGALIPRGTSRAARQK
jgi:hypothetical protein